MAYIHLNPLRAGLVKDIDELADYPWSGHRALLGKKNIAWQAVAETLGHFSHRVQKARHGYLEFLANHRDMRPGALSGGGLIRSRGGIWEVMRNKNDREVYDTRILGEGDFVETSLRRGTQGVSVELPIRMTLEEAMARVTRETGVTSEMVRRAGKSTAQGKLGRSVLAYVAHRVLKMTLTELGDYFGVSQPAVSQLYRMGEIWAMENPQSCERLLAV